MKIVALIATYNERRFITACLDHLRRHGVESYIIDNESTDNTVELARQFQGRGLIGLETFPRLGRFRWADILRRKEELALELDADWYMHVDPDEFRLPPVWAPTLADALESVSRRGYNAVNFDEHVFVPVRESPDHDHARFQETMRWYYTFAPRVDFRLTAWRNQPQRIDLVTSAGHEVMFPGLRRFPAAFPMRHYLCLGSAHAAEKFARRIYDPGEIDRGWHGWRAFASMRPLAFPPMHTLRAYSDDAHLDSSGPRATHIFEDIVPAPHAPVRGAVWGIDRIRCEKRGKTSRIEIDIGGEPLWFESDDVELAPAAEAFAGVLLLPALENGANIRVDLPVDAQWFSSLERAISVYCEWWHYPGRNPVMAARLASPPPPAHAVATCFTCGIDSFYTLLRSRDPETLVFIRGFDMPLDDHSRFSAVRRSIDAVAAARGKRAVVLSTNVRTHPLTGAVAWPRQHGAALAAVGHLLRAHIREFIIPSSDTYDPEVPWGSHWRIDGNFSTASVKITHDASTMKRFDKVAAIGVDPLVRTHLRVCWENRAPTGNCSSCEKCLRTMLDLCASGALPSVATFDHSIPLAARIDALAAVPPHVQMLWRNSLGQSLPAEVRTAVERLLDRSPQHEDTPAAVALH